MENPLNQLGLKKELVEYLHRTNQLDKFLKDYHRNVLTKIHPDKGGDNNLSAIVNSAFSEIRSHPESLESWISGMQNGNGEYLAVIDALAGEVERLRKTEADNEALRNRIAELLTSQSRAETGDVKPAPSGRRRESVPRIVFEEPEVKTPPRGARASPRTAAPRTPPREDAPKKRVTREDYGDYVLIKSDTYTLGVDGLRKEALSDAIKHPTFTRDDGSRIYRPPTFKENLVKRGEAYESAKSEEERTRLFDTWLDSCTGIAYKKGTTKFKIIPVCKELITIDRDFTGSFLPVNYNEIKSIELDSSKGIYSTSAWMPLAKRQLLKHSGWLASVDDDKHLLGTYFDIALAERIKKYGKTDKIMAFWVRQDTTQDELRHLYVRNLSNSSSASGSISLDDSGRFLLGSPTKFSTGK